MASNNNPEVPGLIYKLLQWMKKCETVKCAEKLWQGIMKVQEIRIFSQDNDKKKLYDVDHFIPWSFVMNDGCGI